jgi:hypothetical protein
MKLKEEAILHLAYKLQTLHERHRTTQHSHKRISACGVGVDDRSRHSEHRVSPPLVTMRTTRNTVEPLLHFSVHAVCTHYPHGCRLSRWRRRHCTRRNICRGQCHDINTYAHTVMYCSDLIMRLLLNKFDRTLDRNFNVTFC